MDRIDSATAARLLRAKAHELESRSNYVAEDMRELDFLRLDLALFAHLLADLTERFNAMPHVVGMAGWPSPRSWQPLESAETPPDQVG